MSLHTPRRIFRGPGPKRGLPAIGRRIGLAGIGLLAGMAAVLAAGLTHRPAAVGLPGQSAPEAASGSISASASDVAVIDGNSLRLRDTVVLLQGVDAPTRGRICSDTTGAKVDCGGAAASVLAALVRDKSVECQLGGHDGLGRPFGVCQAEGVQVNEALVAAGWARASLHLAGLQEAQADARAHRLGLWASGSWGQK